MAKGTSYEAPLHYAVFSNLPSFISHQAQIFSSAPYSQTYSVHVPPFHTQTKSQAKL
jgi:hypothetical protein